MTPAELAARSWCTFGEEVLTDIHSRPALGEHYLAFHPERIEVRRLTEASDAGWAAGKPVENPQDILRALAFALARTPRWSGGVPCSVLAHSIRVGAHAGAICELQGDAYMFRAYSIAGGASHDLHEGFPGVGDMPGPVGRWLRSVCPELRRLHEGARDLVRRLLNTADVGQFTLRPNEHTQRVVSWADAAAQAVERAVYFNDAPPWLAEHRALAQHLLVEQVTCDEIRAADAAVTPVDLLKMIRFHTISDAAHRVALHTRRLSGPMGA